MQTQPRGENENIIGIEKKGNNTTNGEDVEVDDLLIY